MRKLGRYELGERIGAGGMGEVFRTVQLGPSGFRRPVAVKVLLPELAEDPELVHRFVDEGRITARLSHPNICHVLELGEERGCHFIAMELLEGKSLARVRRRVTLRGAKIDPAFAAHAIARAAEGLAYAHGLRGEEGRSLELVHRDVSPENIFVTLDGHVKVLDFGLARVAERLSRTRTGRTAGKVSYMAVEQVLSRPVDARADVFALGMVLYELLTGASPYGTLSEVDILRGISDGTLPRFDWDLVPLAFAPLIRSAAHPSLTHRLGSARELQRRLDAIVAQLAPAFGAEQMAAVMQDLFAVDGAEPSGAPEGVAPTQAPDRTVDISSGTTRRKRLWRRAALVIGLGVAGIGGAVQLLRATSEAPRPKPPEWALPPQRASLVQPEPLSVRQIDEPVEVSAKVAPPSRANERTSRPRLHNSSAKAAAPRSLSSLKLAESTRPAAATEPGRLSLDTKPWADVYLGDRRLGSTPLFELELPAGHHTLRLINAGAHLDRLVDVQVVANETTSQRFSF